jgi:hypothetical protein
MAAETLKSFGEGVKRVMDHSKSIDQHMEHTSVSVGNIAKQLFGVVAVWKTVETMMNNSTWGRTMSKVFSTAKLDATDLYRQQHQLARDFDEFNASYVTRLKLGQTTREQAARERADLREQLNLSTAQLRFKLQLQQIGKAELIMSGAFLAAATSAYHVFTETSRILVQSNSSLVERLALTRSILVTQRMLGTDMRHTVEAAADLVDYGYDLDSAFESTLKLVLQMKDGLGLSSKLGAELAVVYERQLRTSARDIADAMARLVNDTSVAADEAGRLAVNIGRAVSLLRPGVNADLSAVTELVGRYEGALKRLGGQFGGFESLLTKITTPEGMLQAGVLGVNNPEFIRSKEATKQVIDQFANYAKGFLGSTEGWERALRLQTLSEMFGTTSQQINLMIRAVDEANSQRQTSITIEQRYKDQVFASAEVFNRLKNSLVALAQQAVLPLIGAVTSVLKPAADFLEYIQKMPGIVTTAAIVLGAGAVLAATQVYRLSAALYTMATAAHLSAVSMRARAAAEFIGPLAPGMGAGGASAMARMSSTLGRYIGIAAGPIMAGAIALAVGYSIGTMLSKYANPQYQQVALKQSTDQLVASVLRRAAFSGDTDTIRDSLIKARGMYLKDGLTLADANTKIANRVKGLGDLAGQVRFTKKTSESSMGPSANEEAEFERMTKAQAEMITIAEQQRDNAVESRKIQEKQTQNAQEAAQQSRTDWMLKGAVDTLKIFNPFSRWQK